MSKIIFYKFNADKKWSEMPDYTLSQLTFCNYSVKIGDTVYEYNTPEFRDAYILARKQEEVWEVLRAKV